jgi:hypothetical protein
LQEVDFFSPDGFVASDGGFDGDGKFKCSYKNPGNYPNKILFNLGWREDRTGIENSYQRVVPGIPYWETTSKNSHI